LINASFLREHAKELGNAVPKSPFFFLKPTSSFLANGGSIEVPQGCDVHHESTYIIARGWRAGEQSVLNLHT
jgi:acylpyruvate hydrolase